MRLFYVFALTAAATVPMTAQSRAPQPRPWEWKDGDRIAVRADRGAAARRVAAARAAGLASGNGLTDVIDGKQSPHLFLPTELFETVIRNGYVLDGWREMLDEEIAAAGLPEDFWQELEPVAALYIADLRERFRLAAQPDQEQARTLLLNLQPQLCRDRADALRKARALFGAPLDVLLYRFIAPTKSITITHDETLAAMQSRERGCR